MHNVAQEFICHSTNLLMFGTSVLQLGERLFAQYPSYHTGTCQSTTPPGPSSAGIFLLQTFPSHITLLCAPVNTTGAESVHTQTAEHRPLIGQHLSVAFVLSGPVTFFAVGGASLSSPECSFSVVAFIAHSCSWIASVSAFRISRCK